MDEKDDAWLNDPEPNEIERTCQLGNPRLSSTGGRRNKIRVNTMTRTIATVIFAVLLTVAVPAMTGGRAEARSCEDDTLQHKSDDGDILIMMSGAVYEVLPGDNIDSALWLPTEDVLICEAPIMYQGHSVMIYEIINTEEGEKVGARRLR